MLSVTFGKYIPVHSRNIASMAIQYKVGDAPDLQSGGGTVGAAANNEITHAPHLFLHSSSALLNLTKPSPHEM